MNTKEFEQKNNVNLIPKSESRLMRAVGWVLKPFTPSFMTYFWTTYRIPFQKPTIAYPPNIQEPTLYTPVLEHEMIHAEDMRSEWDLFKMFCLLLFFPMPVIFSGRWYIERYPYLHNMINHAHHGYTVERGVENLWNNYLWAWPKPLMRKWFTKKLEEHKGASDEERDSL